MKLLWVSPFFLHPTDRGGQIRTLGILSRLHARHEVHFAALAGPDDREGPARASEYSTRSYAVPHSPPRRGSPAFFLQAAAGLCSSVPLAVSRYASGELRELVAGLIATGGFDAVVCDFLASAPNIPDWRRCLLFQHNVETTIWERHAEHGATLLHRAYFGLQARRMAAYEQRICRQAAHIVAVSSMDAERMRQRFGVSRVSATPTGVDIDYFRAPAGAEPVADLVFTGSMDWLPNIDGVSWFLREILPRIRRERPACAVTVAGRRPTREILDLAAQTRGVTVTGTVPDIRPYLWGAAAAIVPLRIGGGTRLKIYESMAAGIPVVSTAIGAEGLDVSDGADILIADTPECFARACLELLESEPSRQRIAAAARRMVAERFSWETVSQAFEEILRAVAAG